MAKRIDLRRSLSTTLRPASLLGLALLGGPGCGAQTDAPAPAPPGVQRSSEWLAGIARPGSIIYGTQPAGAIAAGGVHRSIPDLPYDGALDEIVRSGGDYAILYEPDLRDLGSSLLPLSMDKPFVWYETRIRPIAVDLDPEIGTTVTFRVVRPGGPAAVSSEAWIKGKVGRISHSENHYAHGTLAMRAGKWSPAAGEFLFVIRREPENAAAHNNIGWCLYKAGEQLELAETHARKAVELQESNPDYIDTLVRVLEARGKSEEAASWKSRLP